MLPVLLGTAIRAGATRMAQSAVLGRAESAAVELGGRALAEKGAALLSGKNGPESGGGISEKVAGLLKSQSIGKGGLALDMMRSVMPGGTGIGDQLRQVSDLVQEGRKVAMDAIGKFQPKLDRALDVPGPGLPKPKFGLH